MNQSEKDAQCRGAILQALEGETRGFSDEALGNYLAARRFDISITDIRSYFNYLVDVKLIKFIQRPMVGRWVVEITALGTRYLEGDCEENDPGVMVMRM